MPFYTPLLNPTPLPALGASIERSVQDFKTSDTATPFHRAKDMAAFANHRGGTILVGAAENGGYLSAFKGLSRDDAHGVRRAFSDALERCMPAPTVDFEDYDCPGQAGLRVVAINVEPSLALIGVRTVADKNKEGYAGHAYVFPVRSATSTRFLEPGQLAMLMTPAIRRTAILLARIPADSNIRVIRDHHGSDYAVSKMRLAQINETDNYVELVRNDEIVRVPLDVIIAVFLGPHPNDSSIMWQIVYRWR